MNNAVHSTAPTPAIAPRLGLASQPVYATLVQFPAVCFTGTLLSDLMYWQSKLFQWNNFSAWLVTAGCVIGGFAAVAALVTWLAHPHVRRLRFAGLHLICLVAALVLAIFNAFVHSRDAYASMPDGLVLSAVVFVLMLLATWLGWPRTISTSQGAM